ncbi:MAG: hypothetical protein MJ200_02650 [Mycoplasmoidaceae bacterium]|nr:hypothetical protein [Mycoplasmoidaceae bacterium]
MEKLPNISKKVWCLDVKPTFSISLVLIAFWLLTKRLDGGFSIPLKYFFNVATPELIHIKDGSLTGINDLDGTSK